jgi:hypothetical protein
MVTYSAVFYFAAQWLIVHFKKGSNWLVLPYLLVLPGLLDVVENLYILQFIDGNYCDDIFGIYFTVVRLKWMLIPLGLVVGLSPLAIKAFIKIKKF